MSSNREKKLNKSDVRMGIWKFILSFAVLSVVSFLCLYLFFQSYEAQRAGIEKDAQAYNEIMERHDKLNDAFAEIYQKMGQHDVNKVSNDDFLRTSILDRMQDAKNVMQKDSAGSFKHYAVLLKQINPMLTLKKEIIMQENKKNGLGNELNNCMGRTGILDRELQKDPSRNFEAARRRR
jgi:hypothetical protein